VYKLNIFYMYIFHFIYISYVLYIKLCIHLLFYVCIIFWGRKKSLYKVFIWKFNTLYLSRKEKVNA